KPARPGLAKRGELLHRILASKDAGDIVGGRSEQEKRGTGFADEERSEFGNEAGGLDQRALPRMEAPGHQSSQRAGDLPPFRWVDEHQVAQRARLADRQDALKLAEQAGDEGRADMADVEDPA